MASAASLVVLVVAAGVVSSLAQAVILAGLLPAVLASASAFPASAHARASHASAQWVADPACSHELTCSLEYALLHAKENGINK